MSSVEIKKKKKKTGGKKRKAARRSPSPLSPLDYCCAASSVALILIYVVARCSSAALVTVWVTGRDRRVSWFQSPGNIMLEWDKNLFFGGCTSSSLYIYLIFRYSFCLWDSLFRLVRLQKHAAEDKNLSAFHFCLTACCQSVCLQQH